MIEKLDIKISEADYSKELLSRMAVTEIRDLELSH